MWKEETVPEEWKEGCLIKLPNKGNLSITVPTIEGEQG